MKTAAKVFIILGMIFQCIAIYPIVLGIIALNRLKKARTKDDFGIGWAIVVLLLVNTIAGILLLCMTDSNFADGEIEEKAGDQI